MLADLLLVNQSRAMLELQVKIFLSRLSRRSITASTGGALRFWSIDWEGGGRRVQYQSHLYQPSRATIDQDISRVPQERLLGLLGLGRTGLLSQHGCPSIIVVWERLRAPIKVIFLKFTSVTLKLGTVLGPRVVVWRSLSKYRIIRRPAHEPGILSHWDCPVPRQERLRVPPSFCCTCYDTSRHSRYQTRSGGKCQNTGTS